MPTVAEIKEQLLTPAPLILFDCTLKTGAVESWSTHTVTVGSTTYQARVMRHNLFEMRAASDEGIDSIAKINITLANADSYFSQIMRDPGWKGAKLTASFVFYDLATNTAATTPLVLFQGSANPPDEVTESILRLSFTNRLNLQRLLLPEIRIQRRCPWSFPSNATQRQEAVTGGARGKYSPFHRCGYSPDIAGGVGTNNGATPFTECDYTRASCEQRGMFAERRFGGVEFVPASILVRGHGEKLTQISALTENEARYNDFVPLLYGTVWVQPPIVFSRNDGNLTRMEVLLGAGEINDVLKVVVAGVDVPEGITGTDMTATGWYNVVTPGTTAGAFNLNFTDAQGNPLGDPYGSMAYLAVVVPNRVNDGRSLPKVSVLLEGLRLPQYDSAGTPLGESFSNNPAWVLLDLLRRSGWTPLELDLTSFAAAAAHCSQLISVTDLYGNAALRSRYQSNLAIRRRRSAAEIVRGIRNSAGLYLNYGSSGLLELRVEGDFSTQHPTPSPSSNASQTLNGGWPAYEFGDGANGTSGILRRTNGESSVRLWSRSNSNTVNRYSMEFQDEFNEYQQDSLSLVDVDDAAETGQEISSALPALGLPNFHQATRILRRFLDKSIRGNLFIQFETSVKAVGLKPGDLITVTYLKEGFDRAAFRVTRISPALNHGEAVIEAQAHDDAWYTDLASGGGSSRRQPGTETGAPLPLVGSQLNANQEQEYGIAESYANGTDGSVAATIAVQFTPPARPELTSLGIPYLSLSPSISNSGGTLAGGRTYYYAISGVDAAGAESDLSFVVRAVVPSGSNTNQVTLGSLRFSPGTSAFNVYRGASPQQLLRIAVGQTVSTTFTDTGAAAQLQGPPDPNFDHARFDWRLELHPEVQADIATSTTIGKALLSWTPDAYIGMAVRITAGLGGGQERIIQFNTANTLTLRQPWTLAPDATSKFVIAESSWRNGASGTTSPVQFEIPNREGATIHVSGVALNAQGLGSARELSPLTRWYIVGGTGSVFDNGVPPAPVFGFAAAGQGNVDLAAVGFTDFTNTRTVTSGTLTLHYWNELASPAAFSLGVGIDAVETDLTLALPGPAQQGDIIQIAGEVMEVRDVNTAGDVYTVLRGAYGSIAVAHAASDLIYHLSRRVFIVPFPKDFFGSPASGSFSHPIFLPDTRIAAADLWVTNSRGNSETTKLSLTQNVEQGIRTLSGGQLTMQIEGHLAIQSNASPPLVIENTHSVRDIFAIVDEAPTGADVLLDLKLDGNVYASLTIPATQTYSDTIPGFGMPPLTALSRLTLDVVSVGQTAVTTPGRNLTVAVRL